MYYASICDFQKIQCVACNDMVYDASDACCVACVVEVCFCVCSGKFHLLRPENGWLYWNGGATGMKT